MGTTPGRSQGLNRGQILKGYFSRNLGVTLTASSCTYKERPVDFANLSVEPQVTDVEDPFGEAVKPLKAVQPQPGLIARSG